MRRFAGAAALLAVAVAGVRPVTACINTYQHDDVVRPAQPSPEEIRQNLTTHTPRSEWERKRDAAEARFGYTVDYEAQSDYAAALIHLGEHLRAIPLLEQVEQDHPGLYATATNLGTAYELSGNVEKALHWIREGIRRNPESHEGTEWLHVKILEAKQALAKDPAWLERHGVLGPDFGEGPRPTRPIITANEAQKSIRALEYQLRERTAFVRPTEPIVADLLADLGNLYALYRTPESAQVAYRIALDYGPVRRDLVASRLAYVDNLIWKANAIHWAKWIAGGALVLVLGFWIVSRSLRGWTFHRSFRPA